VANIVSSLAESSVPTDERATRPAVRPKDVFSTLKRANTFLQLRETRQANRDRPEPEHPSAGRATADVGQLMQGQRKPNMLEDLFGSSSGGSSLDSSTTGDDDNWEANAVKSAPTSGISSSSGTADKHHRSRERSDRERKEKKHHKKKSSSKKKAKEVDPSVRNQLMRQQTMSLLANQNVGSIRGKGAVGFSTLRTSTTTNLSRSSRPMASDVFR